MTPHHGRYCAYYRVSTTKQGDSGLGLDAQKARVKDFLDGGRWQLVENFTETESGRRDDRPELKRAIEYCKKHKETKLVVATLSRLTRDTKFLLTLLDGNVDVVFCDLPQVPPGAMGRFFLTMMAAVSEFEAGLTAERTKAALAAARARGVRLGNPVNLSEARVKGGATLQAKADAFAKRVSPIIASIRKSGVTSLRDIAAELDTRGIRTPRGGNWSAQQVSLVEKRAARLGQRGLPIST